MLSKTLEAECLVGLDTTLLACGHKRNGNHAAGKESSFNCPFAALSWAVNLSLSVMAHVLLYQTPRDMAEFLFKQREISCWVEVKSLSTASFGISRYIFRKAIMSSGETACFNDFIDDLNPERCEIAVCAPQHKVSQRWKIPFNC